MCSARLLSRCVNVLHKLFITCHSQGIDRDFLQELLLYLEQQRRQLDDSKELLERLGQDIPSVSHISVSHHQSGSQSTHQV